MVEGMFTVVPKRMLKQRVNGILDLLIIKSIFLPHLKLLMYHTFVLAPDFELPAQQILPESELQPFEV